MDFVQTILTLDRTWPCRRTRWWMLMKPVEYRIHAIPDLPEDQLLRQIGQLMPNWPFWSLDHEEALQLTEYELMIMQDQRYGNDLRQLTRQDVMPCFLHSYSTALQACPCGCRETGFNPQRLLRDGVRGFYIVSMLTGKHRWLHPREAALFCGLDPKMQLPDDLRAGLCLVGKCASPLQAAWMSAHLLDALHAGRGTPQKSLILYKMRLLRQAHGMFPKNLPASLQLMDEEEGTEIIMSLGGLTTVANVLEAERRLQGGGTLRSLMDLYGKLPNDYDITHGAVVGSLELHHRDKRQKKAIEYRNIMVTVVLKHVDGHTTDYTMEVMTGIFVFEVMRNVPPGLHHVYYKQIVDAEGNEWRLWRLDERVMHDVKFVQYHMHHEICAWGSFDHCEKALGNKCIDKWARRMLYEMNQFSKCTWIPPCNALC